MRLNGRIGSLRSGVAILTRVLVIMCSYDLLCLEGLAMALRVFLLKDPIPTFRVADVAKSSLQKMIVKPEVRRCWSTLFSSFCGKHLYMF